MQPVAQILSCVFAALALVLLGFWLSLRHSLREMERQLQEKLATDTNTLITLSTADSAARRLAGTLNRELYALRSERLHLQNGDRELKSAVTNLSHDLRTPLTAVRGYLDLLETEQDLTVIRKDLAVIRERTDTMTALTDELFRYSMAVSAEQTLHPQPLCLNDILCESFAAFYATLTEKGVAPQISLPDKPVIRTLDAKALRRVFGNILSNAVKYSGGDLAAALTEDGTITFTNTAPQLSSVDVQRLFNRFYTVETAGRSTGLGLAIAKHLTEEMGGSIAAEYKNGKLSIRILFAQ